MFLMGLMFSSVAFIFLYVCLRDCVYVFLLFPGQENHVLYIGIITLTKATKSVTQNLLIDLHSERERGEHLFTS